MTTAQQPATPPTPEPPAAPRPRTAERDRRRFERRLPERTLIATLGMLSLARGAVLVLSDGRLIYAEGAGFDFSILLQESLFGMPVAGLGVVALRLAGHGLGVSEVRSGDLPDALLDPLFAPARGLPGVGPSARGALGPRVGR